MKNHNLILLAVICLCLIAAGCASTLSYDSRGQNAIDMDNPQYQGATMDKVNAKTGRYFFLRINLFQPANIECLLMEEK